MVKLVLDSSAILAFLLGEPGGGSVKKLLPDAAVSALNFHEVLERTSRLCGSVETAKQKLNRLGLTVMPFDGLHSMLALSILPADYPQPLCLAERAFLALAVSLGVPAVTANSELKALDLGISIKVIR